MGYADDRARAPGLAVDVTLGLAYSAVASGRLLTGHDWQVSWPAVTVAVTAVVALTLRRRWPWAALAVAIAGGVLAARVDLAETVADALLGTALLTRSAVRWARARSNAVAVPEAYRPARRFTMLGASRPAWRFGAPALAALVIFSVAVPADLKEAASVPVLLAAYATATDRVTALVSATVAAGALAIGSTMVTTDAWTGPDTPVPLVAAAVVGAAAGDAARSRRQLIIAWQERARQSAHAAEEKARHRAIEERLRIAREVHDLVAHHIAVVSMQAGVAAYHLRQRPEAAEQAIGHVQAASRTVLDQLGSLLSVLRADEPAPVEPAPGLADLPELLESFATLGLPVRVTRSGSVRTLPETVDLSGYRVVQESLTNAHKHGSGPVRLAFRYHPDQLEIEVRNPVADPAPERTPGRHGVLGMSERVRAIGGELSAGRDETRDFVVRVVLPIRPDHRATTALGAGRADTQPTGRAGADPAGAGPQEVTR